MSTTNWPVVIPSLKRRYVHFSSVNSRTRASTISASIGDTLVARPGFSANNAPTVAHYGRVSSSRSVDVGDATAVTVFFHALVAHRRPACGDPSNLSGKACQRTAWLMLSFTSCRATPLTLLYSLQALRMMITPLPTSLLPHAPTQMALLPRPTPALVALPKTVIATGTATCRDASPVKMIMGQVGEGAKIRMAESMQN